MGESIDSIAGATFWLIRGRDLFLFLHLLGLVCFAYIVARRLAPLLRAQRDFRFDRPLERLGRVLRFWLAQWRHPRYRFAGTIHILIFAGFLILASRAFTVLLLGISDSFAVGESGGLFNTVRDYASTVVFLCMGIMIARRLVFPPARYGHRSADAVFLLALIGILMAADGVFEGSSAAFHALAPLSLPWILKPLSPPLRSPPYTASIWARTSPTNSRSSSSSVTGRSASSSTSRRRCSRFTLRSWTAER